MKTDKPRNDAFPTHTRARKGVRTQRAHMTAGELGAFWQFLLGVFRHPFASTSLGCGYLD